MYTIPSNLIRVTISPDGNKLLRFEKAQEADSLYFAVVYDLMTKEEIFASRPQPYFLGHWLLDGRIEYLANLERQIGEGEYHEFLVLDMATQLTETVNIELDLPRYEYSEEPLYQGIASVDPLVQRALYTMGGFDVTLRDIMTGTNIWHYDGAYGLYPFPKWTGDGSKVLFSIPVDDGEQRYHRIFSLTRGGQEEELPPQPYPGLDAQEVRYLTFSFDERYIHYSLQETLLTGEGFIVDVSNSWVGEICSGKGTFIEGQWVAEGQFVYNVLLEGGGQSLQLLDVPTWTSQILAELPSGEGFVVYGWTPLDLSSP